MNADNMELYSHSIALFNRYDLNQTKKQLMLEYLGYLEQIRQNDCISYASDKKLKGIASQIRKTVTQLAMDNRRIITIIDRVEGDTERGIITDRIVNGMKWEAIADKYAYCPQQTLRIYYKGLEDIERRLKHRKGQA